MAARVAANKYSPYMSWPVTTHLSYCLEDTFFNFETQQQRVILLCVFVSMLAEQLATTVLSEAFRV